jgi:SAM-dependent methyltransferase
MATSFEDADLPVATFDAVIAAMSFHWVDQGVGLAKLGRVLRPGGWAASWWTVFGDPDRDDPFRDATAHVLAPTSAGFELDIEARCADLGRGARLVDVGAEAIRWTARLDTVRLRALYASMIAVRSQPERERRRVLDAVVDIAEREFGGVIERPFVTVLYTARRPGATTARR